MPEMVPIDRYPDINWSREYTHADGDPASSFGVTKVLIGENGLCMTYDHKLQPFVVVGVKDSRLTFGQPESRKICVTTDEETLFSLEDPQRINEALQHAKSFTAAIHVVDTARIVVTTAEKLLQTIRIGTGEDFPDSSLVEQAGVIENFIQNQRDKILPEKVVVEAQALKELRIRDIWIIGKETGDVWPIDWVIENFIQRSTAA